MKKIIFVLLVLILIVSLTGCNLNYTQDTEGNDNRMTLIYNNGCRIYVDNETGVQYIINGGICVMVDENGNPLIYNSTEKGGAE